MQGTRELYGDRTEPSRWGQGKLIPTQSNAFPTQIMRWKDVERSKANYKQVNLTNNCKVLKGFVRFCGGGIGRRSTRRAIL